ncbi:MAG: hypothetical protein AAB628_00210 [Patescibacteria group bacterium]
MFKNLFVALFAVLVVGVAHATPPTTDKGDTIYVSKKDIDKMNRAGQVGPTPSITWGTYYEVLTDEATFCRVRATVVGLHIFASSGKMMGSGVLNKRTNKLDYYKVPPEGQALVEACAKYAEYLPEEAKRSLVGIHSN